MAPTALFFLNLALSLISSVVLGTLILVVGTSKSPLNKIPGPWYARYTGARLTLATIAGRRIHYIDALHKQYGPFVRVAPDEVAVNDAAAFKQIHSVPGYEKSSWYQASSPVDYPAIFGMPNKAHAVRRRMFARAFSMTNIRQHWERAVRQKVELAVTKMIDEARQHHGTVDVLKWWTFMTTDISAEIMFGESFNTLERGEVNEFIRCLSQALKGGGIGAELPLVRQIGRRLPFKAAQELFNISSYLMENTNVAVKNMQASRGGRNIFATIVAEAEKGEELTEKDVQVEAMSLLIAGSDTTAITLTYLVWVVCSMPELREALEKEVGAVPEGYKDADLERLPLLSAVVEETLRLYCAAPGALPRVVPAKGVTFGEYFVPGGTVVVTQAYSFHRDPEVFPEPLKFIPSRWLVDEDDRDLQVSEGAKAVFHPFGAGSRSCLGIHVAYMELRLGAVDFFRRCPGSKPGPSATQECMEFENYFLITPRGHQCEIVLGEKT